MTVDREHTLRMTRHFDASPERVFDAWLDPQTAGKWLFTSPSSEKHSAEIDARVGGAYTIFDRREGKDYTAVGEYLEIDRPHRLVFTFGMPQFSPDFDRITVEIVPDGAGCLLTLTQEDLRTGYKKSTKSGWSKMLDALAGVLRQEA